MELDKLKNMMKNYFSGNLILNQSQFKTLRLAYLNEISRPQEIIKIETLRSPPIVRLNPPPPPILEKGKPNSYEMAYKQVIVELKTILEKYYVE